MLPKSQRLNLKKGFNFVAAGRKTTTNNFKLMYRLSENPHPLIGVAISSKVFRQANERNKVKRLTFKAAQIIYSSLKTNLNLVIMPKAAVLQASLESLVSELKNVKDIFSTN